MLERQAGLEVLTVRKQMAKGNQYALAKAAVSLLILVFVQPVTADVVAFEDKDEWIEAVDEFALIDVVGIPGGTEITTQFEDRGIVFPPGETFVQEHPFIPDGFALITAGPIPISFTLSEPQQWVATDYPGCIRISLFLGEELVFESETFFSFGVDFAFAGLVSSTPFDRVTVHDPFDGVVAVDNLYVAVSTRDDADVNADGVVDTLDLVAVILAWGSDDRAADITDDGIVGVDDLIQVIVDWD